MAPNNPRFGGPTLSSTPFAQLQQSAFPSHASQHQPSNSGSLPPPLHHGFSQSSPSLGNPFAPTNGLAGGFGPGGALGTGGTGLGSREAMLRFQNGAEMEANQRQAQMRRASGGGGMGSKGSAKSRIRDVWRSNLQSEMKILREVAEHYPYISMDTEFPGIVARPMGAFTTTADYHYQVLRCNVDLLKVIQLGITLFDENGNVPDPDFQLSKSNSSYQNPAMSCPHTWQFNFEFDLQDDMAAEESIEMLQKAGLDFAAHAERGINARDFGAVLISSGLVGFDEVRWMSFHSAYDFGYLVKLLWPKPLPEEENEFRELLKKFFPSIYDIKFMVKSATRSETVNKKPLSAQAAALLKSLGIKSGLQDLGEELGVKRVGTAHTAGSDSFLTGRVFWEVKKQIFGGEIDETLYLGNVWGLNNGTSPMAPAHGAQDSGTDGHLTTPNLNGATIYNNSSANTNQGTPGTPANSHTGLASTPVQQVGNNGGVVGSLTPGGGGGVFGAFRGFGRG